MKNAEALAKVRGIMSTLAEIIDAPETPQSVRERMNGSFTAMRECKAHYEMLIKGETQRAD